MFCHEPCVRYCPLRIVPKFQHFHPSAIEEHHSVLQDSCPFKFSRDLLKVRDELEEDEWHGGDALLRLLGWDVGSENAEVCHKGNEEGIERFVVLRCTVAGFELTCRPVKGKTGLLISVPRVQLEQVRAAKLVRDDGYNVCRLDVRKEGTKRL